MDANPGILDLSPALRLEPGRRYLLVMDFPDRAVSGTLLVEGKGFFRLYSLPLSGEPRAFGSGPESSRVIPLWTSSGQPVEARLRFVPSGGAPPSSYSPFARFELREYRSADLPVHVESLIPYRARVRSDAPAFLETPRLFVRGYEATVDGRAAPVYVSRDGYAIVPVEPGTHEVTVSYRAPGAVQMAYWVGVVGWLALLGAGAWSAVVLKGRGRAI